MVGQFFLGALFGGGLGGFRFGGFSCFAHGLSLVVAALAKGNKKPTAVASRGFLLKFRSTSANGVANYDD